LSSSKGDIITSAICLTQPTVSTLIVYPFKKNFVALKCTLIKLNCKSVEYDYRTRAIITRSWFETGLDYKPRILGPTFLVYVLKWSVILTFLALKNGVKNIQTAGYNGAFKSLLFLLVIGLMVSF